MIQKVVVGNELNRRLTSGKVALFADSQQQIILMQKMLTKLTVIKVQRRRKRQCCSSYELVHKNSKLIHLY